MLTHVRFGFIDVDEYEQLKLADSKLAESEKIIKEHLKIKPEPHHPEETQTNSDLEQTEEVLLSFSIGAFLTNYDLTNRKQ